MENNIIDIRIEEDNEISNCTPSEEEAKDNESNNCTSSEEEYEENVTGFTCIRNKPAFIFVEKQSHSSHDISYTSIEMINVNQPSPCDLVKLIKSEDMWKYILKC